MSVTISQFGKTVFGEEFKLYTIENAKGMKAAVTNLGAILVNLYTPDDKGEYKDIVLGFDTAEEYLLNGSFFGATIGRSANRIANAKFTIDGQEYSLPVNDNDNNLHSDFFKGFHKQLWNAKEVENGVEFTYTAADGETGYPGKLDVSVTYTVTDDNELSIHYEAVSDKKTVINLTNHSYFNLCGHDSGKILDTELMLNASHYTQEELTKKAHNFELEESGYTVLCLDARQSGIGTNSCGPELFEKYRMDNDKNGKFPYELNVVISF